MGCEQGERSDKEVVSGVAEAHKPTSTPPDHLFSEMGVEKAERRWKLSARVFLHVATSTQVVNSCLDTEKNCVVKPTTKLKRVCRGWTWV